MIKKMLGLPGYFGGKRRITPYIFRYLPKPSKQRDLTFLDPFMGGGSVSYYAKLLGYKVISGDIAYRSKIIGKAVIENNKQKLPDWQVFLEPNDNTWLYDNYRQYFPTDDFPKLFDTIRENIKKRGDKPVELFFYLKMLLYLIPFNLLIYKREEYQGTTEEEKIRRLSKHKLWSKFKKYIANPYAFIRTNWKHVNKVIYNNGQENKFKQQDVFKSIEEFKDQADIIYFDPPYPSTLSYDELMWADRMVRQDNDYKEQFGAEWTDPSTFPEQFKRMIEASKDIPNLIISIGNYDHKQLLEWVQEHRPKAKMFSIKHQWLNALIKKEKGDELLILDLRRWYE